MESEIKTTAEVQSQPHTQPRPEGAGVHAAVVENLTHPKYRPDIDGLRAIAVLAVVGFHAFPERIYGGFIGVDIFFVISGFLISTIIFKSLAYGEFSFAEFYGRRIRRIFPALATVLLVSFVAGWFILYPGEYKQLGKHIAGGAGFVSNFVLWTESGYFDSAAETKPLLHLWSLGIEEQFYIIFPLLVWAAWKCRLNLLSLTLCIGLGSFLLNLHYVYKDAVWTFYQPQTRFWELMVGALLSLLVIDLSGVVKKAEAALDRLCAKIIYQAGSDIPAGRALANSKAWLGALVLVAGLWLTTRQVHFPGKWALLPTVGTALAIWAGPQAWLNKRVLSNQMLVWVGKISFPLYLWHWAILSYLRIMASETPAVGVRVAAVVAAIVLSWLTYQWIEMPLRFGGDSRKKTMGLAGAMIAVALLGLVVFKTSGFQSMRRNAVMSNGEQFDWKYMTNPECAARITTHPGFCMLLGNPNRISVGVLGDSTANSLVPGVAELVSGRGEGMINIGHGACPPIRGLVPTASWGANPNCPQIVEDAYHVVLNDDNIKTVIMSLFARDIQSWGFKDLPASASLQERFDKAKLMLDKDIKALQAKGKKVILSYDAPYSPVSGKDCVTRPYSSLLKKHQNCEITEDKIIDRYPYLTLFDNHYKDRGDICVFHQSDLLFTDGKLNFMDRSGTVLLRDTHHLTEYGSRKMVQMLAQSHCRSYLPW